MNVNNNNFISFDGNNPLEDLKKIGEHLSDGKKILQGQGTISSSDGRHITSGIAISVLKEPKSEATKALKGSISNIHLQKTIVRKYEQLRHDVLTGKKTLNLDDLIQLNSQIDTHVTSKLQGVIREELVQAQSALKHTIAYKKAFDLIQKFVNLAGKETEGGVAYSPYDDKDAMRQLRKDLEALNAQNQPELLMTSLPTAISRIINKLKENEQPYTAERLKIPWDEEYELAKDLVNTYQESKKTVATNFKAKYEP